MYTKCARQKGVSLIFLWMYGKTKTLLSIARVFKENNKHKAEEEENRAKGKKKDRKEVSRTCQVFGELKRKNGLSVRQKK